MHTHPKKTQDDAKLFSFFSELNISLLSAWDSIQIRLLGLVSACFLSHYHVQDPCCGKFTFHFMIESMIL